MMNILSKMAVSSLKRNRLRTLTIFGGITLATVMITVVLIIGGIFNDGISEILHMAMGKWDIKIEKYDEKKVESFLMGEEVNSFGRYQQRGTLKNLESPLYIGTKDFFSLEPWATVEGRTPKKEGEILMPIGKKKIGEIEIGSQIEEKEGATFTIVGFYSIREYVGDGEGALALGKINPQEPVNFLIAAKTQEDREKIEKDLEKEKIPFDSNSRLDFNSIGIEFIQGFLILIIFLGAISQMSNGFRLSLQGRRREVGVLRSTGMTMAQYKKIIYLEAFILGSIGIPLGMAMALIGIEGFLKLFQSSVEKIFYGEMITLDLGKMYILKDFLITILTTGGTIALSIFFSLKKITKCSPIELMKYVDVKKKKKKVKSPLIGKENILWLLAWKNYKLNKKNYRGIIFSLSITIIMLIVSGYFLNQASSGMAQLEKGIPKNVYVYYLNNEKIEGSGEGFTIPIEDIEGVKVNIVNGIFGEVNLKKSGQGAAEETIPVNIALVKKEELAKEDRQKLGRNKFLSTGEIKAPPFIAISKESERKFISEGGTTLGSIKIEKNGKEESIKAEIIQTSSLPVIVQDHFGEGIDLVTTIEDNPHLIDESKAISSQGSGYREIVFETDGTETAYGNMTQLLFVNDMDTSKLLNSRENIEGLIALIKVLKALTLLFIYMTGLFALMNIFNTISTNILLRKRDFSILRSVGFSGKHLKKILSYESAIIGGKALLYGGILGSLLILAENGFAFYEEIVFIYPWKEILVLLVAVIVSIHLTNTFSHRKIMKEDVVEVVREANM